MSIEVNHKRCPQNHLCPAVQVCPVNAITQEGYAAPKVDQEKCIDCGACARFCPLGALTFANPILS